MERPQEAAAAVAAAAETIALYDACWFHRLVLLPSSAPPVPMPAPAAQAPLEREVEQPQRVSSSPTAGGLRHRRTRSDEATAAAFQGLEPLRIPNSGHRARLETILSGKDGLVAAPQPQPQPLPERRRPEARRPAGSGRRRRRRRWRGRSLSELEFEEVKGLRDLGFTFSDAEVDAELASIVPGLRRKRSEGEEAIATASAPAAARAASSSADEEAVPNAASASVPRRPYLSEAWDDEEEEVQTMLQNWRIPAASDGADLKEHLRMWAHTVASAVQ